MGHEMSGWVEQAGATGPGVGALVDRRASDQLRRVQGVPRRARRTCAATSASTASTPPAAMAQYVALPPEVLHEVPEGVDPRTATLAEPLAVAVHAVDLSGMQAGDTVADLRCRAYRGAHRPGRAARRCGSRGRHRAERLAPRGRRRPRVHRRRAGLDHGRDAGPADRRRGRRHHVRLRRAPVGGRRARRRHPRPGAHRRRRRVQEADARSTCRPSASRSSRWSACASTPRRT